MSDYNFNGLSPRSFEQMIQALSTKLIGPNIIIFGDGPDGGREATFEGTIPYPSTPNQWNGYGVIQAKFLQRPQTTVDQGEWALSQLRSELEMFANPAKERKKPEYYIFVTNAVLSPVKDVGAKDKAKAIFDAYKTTVPLKDYDIWDFDKLRALLDNNDQVRKKYAAFITAGDVLAEIMARIEFERADFEATLSNFLEKELLTDQFANLEQAGHATNDRIPIARVFTDLPTHTEPVIEPVEEELATLLPGFVASVVEIAKDRLNPVVITDDSRLQRNTTLGRLVLIGGPGQGKSTIGQFCCQLFRTALLKDRPQHLITPPARSVVSAIVSFCARERIELPSARRFPLRIELSAFASALASKDEPKITSVLTYLTQLISKRTSLSISANDFREWLRNYPWLIILDGLDEVPSSTNRQDVLSAIQDFWVDAAQLDADLLVIATTRPQGYNDDFSPRYYEHKWLTPLSNARALHYGELLANARYGNEPDRCNRIVKRLTRALQHPATARLMRSPLQVTIMATLVERMGTPPQERWQLFKSYYDIIFMREMERDIPAAAILRDYRSDIDAIHNLVGLLLQIESERTGTTEAQLTADKFSAVVRARLESEGHEGSELEELKDKIIDAAANRLVFLVGLQENRIGFEIRSLQEFMASEALMDGKDETIRLRLRTIAMIANWRNVFLFAAGKCFAVQQALRDTIVTIAAELNENSEDKAWMVTLAGSQLCLDLLADGASRRQPKYGRTLARIALRLLSLPPVEYQRRLAALYDVQFEEIFRQELIETLDSSVPEHRLGAWVCLFNLIEAGIEWAESIGERYWSNPQNTEDLFQIMSFVTFRPAPSWLTNKIVEKLHSVSPRSLNTILRSNRLSLDFLREVDNTLVTATISACLTRYNEGNEIGINSVSDSSRKIMSQRFVVRFFNTPIHRHYSPKILPLLTLSSPTNDWLPMVKAAAFLKDPNTASLAATLRSIATTNWDRTELTPLSLPWPVAACLGVCQTQDDINSIAARIESGELGSLQDWERAEQRWANQGLTSSDFEYMIDERLPFTRAIGDVGFPFSDFTLSTRILHTELKPQVVGLLEIYRRTSGSLARSVIGQTLLFVMEMIQDTNEGETIELKADEFKRVIADTVGGGKRVWASALGALPLTDPVSDEWIEVMDFIGEQSRISRGRPNQSTIKIIHSTFLRHPERKGIMKLLALTAPHSNLPPIPLEINPQHFDNKVDRNAATILMLEQNDTRTVLPNARLAKFTAALLEDHPELDVTRLHGSKPTRGIEADNSFWFSLLDELPPTAWKSRQNIMRRFEESMSVRSSGLDQPKTWEALQLPIALRDFFQNDSQSN